MDEQYEARFGGMGRLVGRSGQAALHRAHVCVVGVGGVGSWGVEALARSGVGRLTLIDLDDVCITNVNRQLPALTGTFGRPKVEVLAERAALINPSCEVKVVQEFLTASNVERLLTRDMDHVFDAIDGVGHKCVMIEHCRDEGIPITVAGSAGGKTDPAQIEVDDLSRVTHDRLLQRVRKVLRKEHGFPRDPKRKFRVECVFSRAHV